MQWLLGRHEIQLGLVTRMKRTLGVTTAWQSEGMLPKLGAQLVALDLCENEDVWPVLFQLQALSRLRLSVISSADSIADSSSW